MQSIVIDKPYVPVPPYRRRAWPALLSRYIPRLLLKRYGVTKVECVHADRLKQSLDAGHGILLAPNHSRDEDPFVLNGLSRAAHTPMVHHGQLACFHAGPMAGVSAEPRRRVQHLSRGN